MKKVIFAIFKNIEDADRAISHVNNELHISKDEISYVYKDKSGKRVSGEGVDISKSSALEGVTSGATAGGLIGAAIGLVGIAGLLGPFGPIVVAGPLATFLGITGGAGAVIGAGVAGAAIGGLVGALTSMGVSESQAKNYDKRVGDGDVLVSFHSENPDEMTRILREFNAEEITVIEPRS